MALMILTQRFYFRGTHALEVGEHREKRHGHHYLFEVSAKPEDCVQTFRAAEELSRRLDGRDLTKICDPSTGEMLVEYLDQELRNENVQVFALALQETRKNRFLSARSSELAL